MNTGRSISLPKSKIKGELSLMGEDYFITDENGFAICDGIGGYDFSTLYASTLVSLAVKDFYLRKKEILETRFKEKISAIRTENPKGELKLDSLIFEMIKNFERSIKNYIFAYNFVLDQYLKKYFPFQRNPRYFLAEETNSESLLHEEQYFIDKFIYYSEKGLPSDYKGPDLPLTFKSKPVADVFEIGTTLIAASLLLDPITETIKLLIYKKGDSLLSIFRGIVDQNGKVAIQPVFMSHENSSAFNSPDHIKLSEIETTWTQSDKPPQLNFAKRSQKEVYLVGVSPDDIILGGSDGLWDNLPVSVLTLLITKVLKSFIENEEMAVEQIRELLQSEIEGVLIEFISATNSKILVEKDIENLRRLEYLQPKQPLANKKDIFEHIKKVLHDKREIESMSSCTPAEIFYVRFTSDTSGTQTLLSSCMTKLLRRVGSIEFSVFRRGMQMLNSATLSDMLCLATKIYSAMNYFVDYHNEVFKIHLKVRSLLNKAKQNKIDLKKFENQKKQIDGIIFSTNNLNKKENKDESKTPTSQQNAFKNFGVNRFEDNLPKNQKIEQNGQILNQLYFVEKHIKELKRQLEIRHKEMSYKFALAEKVFNHFQALKIKMIAGNLISESHFKTAQKIAEKLFYYPITSVYKKSDVDLNLEEKIVLSVFSIREFIYNQQSGDLAFSSSAKPDDFTAVAGVIAFSKEKDTKEPHSEMFTEQFNTKKKGYFARLLKSVDLWLKNDPTKEKMPEKKVLV